MKRTIIDASQLELNDRVVAIKRVSRETRTTVFLMISLENSEALPFFLRELPKVPVSSQAARSVPW